MYLNVYPYLCQMFYMVSLVVYMTLPWLSTKLSQKVSTQLSRWVSVSPWWPWAFWNWQGSAQMIEDNFVFVWKFTTWIWLGSQVCYTGLQCQQEFSENTLNQRFFRIWLTRCPLAAWTLSYDIVHDQYKYKFENAFYTLNLGDNSIALGLLSNLHCKQILISHQNHL